MDGPAIPPIVDLGGEDRPYIAGRSASLSSQVVAEVRDALFARRLKPGDFLGTEKDIAARFGASRIVARDALRTLEALGVVEIRMGKGGGAPAEREPAQSKGRKGQESFPDDDDLPF